MGYILINGRIFSTSNASIIHEVLTTSPLSGLNASRVFKDLKTYPGLFSLAENLQKNPIQFETSFFLCIRAWQIPELVKEYLLKERIYFM